MGPEPSDFEEKKIRCANCFESVYEDNEDCPECGVPLQEALKVGIEFYCKNTSDLLGLADSIEGSAGCFYGAKHVVYVDVPYEIAKENALYPVYKHLGESGRTKDIRTLLMFSKNNPEQVGAFLSFWEKKAGHRDINRAINSLAKLRTFGAYSFEKLPSHGGGFVVVVRASGDDPIAFADTNGLYFWAGGKLSEREHSELMEWCEVGR